MKLKTKIRRIGIAKQCIVIQPYDIGILDDVKSASDRDDLWVTIQPEGKSKNINAYMWKLCRLISEKTGVSDLEVYQDAVVNANCNNWFDGQVHKDQFEDFVRTITYDHDGWKVAHYTESKSGMIWYRCYYGSSAFTKDQMNKLVDYIVREAESYNIPTLESEKIERLLQEWKS